MTPTHKTILPYLGLMGLGLLWGSNFAYMKIVSYHIEPLQIAWLRFLFGSIPVVAYAAFKGYIKLSHVKHIVPLSVMALGGTAFYYYTYAVGTSLLYSGIAGLLSGSIPLFSFLAAYCFLREDKISPLRVCGMLIGFAGIVIIARPLEVIENWQSANVIGVAYMTIGSAAVGASFVFAKKYILPLKIHPIALVAYQLVISCSVLAAFTDYRGITAVADNAWVLAAMVLGLGVFGTSVAYMLYYYIIDKLGAVSASSVSYLAPLIAFAIGVVIIGENIAPQDYIAAACIFISVLLISRKNNAK